MNQQVAARLLARRGHEVTIAGDGAEALAILERQTFDVVLMDLQMPVMDGIEATGVIRAREQTTGAHLHIVAMTRMRWPATALGAWPQVWTTTYPNPSVPRRFSLPSSDSIPPRRFQPSTAPPA